MHASDRFVDFFLSLFSHEEKTFYETIKNSGEERELTDSDLDTVWGGMSRESFSRWRCNYLNENMIKDE